MRAQRGFDLAPVSADKPKVCQGGVMFDLKSILSGHLMFLAQ